MSENTTTKNIGWGHLSRTVTVVDVEGHEFIATNAGLRTLCHKCLGVGGFMVYAGLHNGVCYTCNGVGLSGKTYADEAAVTKSLRAAERREARREAKVAAEAAVAAAERDVWVAANPTLAARLAEIDAEVYITAVGEHMTEAAYEALHAGHAKYGEFIAQMASNSSWKPLTENQTAAVAKALADLDVKIEAAAAKAATQRYLDAAEGAKVAVTGTVVVATNVDTAYGVSRLVVIEADGENEGVTIKTFGTGATLWETSKGDVVEITGTVKGFEEYNNTAQTVLTRTKIKALATA